MEHLKGLTQPQELDLGATQVTNAGLEHLKGLSQRQALLLAKKNATVEGVRKLKETLPGGGDTKASGLAVTGRYVFELTVMDRTRFVTQEVGVVMRTGKERAQ